MFSYKDCVLYNTFEWLRNNYYYDMFGSEDGMENSAR